VPELCAYSLLHHHAGEGGQLRSYKLVRRPAAYKLDPEGPIFEVEKGELIDR